MQPLQSAGYTVYFNEDGHSQLQQLLVPGAYSKLFVLADSNTAQHCLPQFLQQLATEIEIEIIEIEPGEENKTIDTCTGVWRALAELGADRKSLMVNVGGGMVTDLGAFVASTFMRGIDYINVPTSLLAMVDASVGGKTGVDLDNLKNHVGVFSTPKSVIIDVNFLETLPQDEMRSGLAEMLKHGIIADRNYWNNFTDMSGMTTDDLAMLIHRSVEIKNNIVLTDPKEHGERMLLNFGHTLGHAIESYFLGHPEKPTLLHGEAIAIGMILESYLSFEKGMLPIEEYREIREVILSIFQKNEFTATDIENIISLMAHDKKNAFGSVNFTLPVTIGSAEIKQQAENALIYKAFADYEN
ncbi:MAG: 3-dehydroquinate synthase [Flavobacterium sp.]